MTAVSDPAVLNGSAPVLLSRDGAVATFTLNQPRRKDAMMRAGRPWST